MAKSSQDRPGDRLFWRLAEEHLDRPGVERGTMMTSACLRAGGDFYTMVDRRNGGLIVKLPADRVTELVTAGRGEEFAPAGRVFREWLFVAEPDEEAWRGLMNEAHAFVSR